MLYEAGFRPLRGVDAGAGDPRARGGRTEGAHRRRTLRAVRLKAGSGCTMLSCRVGALCRRATHAPLAGSAASFVVIAITLHHQGPDCEHASPPTPISTGEELPGASRSLEVGDPRRLQDSNPLRRRWTADGWWSTRERPLRHPAQSSTTLRSLIESRPSAPPTRLSLCRAGTRCRHRAGRFLRCSTPGPAIAGLEPRLPRVRRRRCGGWWLSDYRQPPGAPARFDPAHRRASNRERTGDIVALKPRFSDGYPIPAISEASADPQRASQRLAARALPDETASRPKYRHRATSRPSTRIAVRPTPETRRGPEAGRAHLPGAIPSIDWSDLPSVPNAARRPPRDRDGRRLGVIFRPECRILRGTGARLVSARNRQKRSELLSG